VETETTYRGLRVKRRTYAPSGNEKAVDDDV
jgi:hypothetical protein